MLQQQEEEQCRPAEYILPSHRRMCIKNKPITQEAQLSLKRHSVLARLFHFARKTHARPHARMHHPEPCAVPPTNQPTNLTPPVCGLFYIYTAGTRDTYLRAQAVGESVSLPLLYYQNNIMSTLVLLEELGKTSCRNFVFSSSATVYGTSPSPITESSKVGDGITNPYGKTIF